MEITGITFIVEYLFILGIQSLNEDVQKYLEIRKNSRKMGINRENLVMKNYYTLPIGFTKSYHQSSPETQYSQENETPVQKQFIRVLDRLKNDPKF